MSVLTQVYFKPLFIECVLSACMYVRHVFVWSAWRSEEGTESPATGITNGSEPPCRCEKADLASLKEQMLLTTKQSPSSGYVYLYIHHPLHFGHALLFY